MYETIFNGANLFVMIFWFLMIFLPFWGWTQRIMRSLWTVVPMALVYALLVLPNALTLLAELANPSVTNIAALLGTPAGATIGWIHFLAFDLFVGRWAYLDSRQRGINGFLVSPTLFFVFMFGPLGLLLYLLVRAVASRRDAITA
jgi:Domain of unknown function (DUF4281)